MVQLTKTTIGELLAKGASKDTEVYVMADAELSPDGDFSLYLYYIGVLARLFEVDVNDLLGSSRRLELIEPRVFAWKRLIEVDEWGLRWIARVSGRTRSCIFQLVEKMNARMEKIKSDRLNQMYEVFCNIVENKREIDTVLPFDVSFGKQRKKQIKVKKTNK